MLESTSYQLARKTGHSLFMNHSAVFSFPMGGLPLIDLPLHLQENIIRKVSFSFLSLLRIFPAQVEILLPPAADVQAAGGVDSNRQAYNCPFGQSLMVSTRKVTLYF